MTLIARCASCHPEKCTGTPSGRGVRYVRLATVAPMRTNLSIAGCMRLASQHVKNPPPETNSTQRSILFDGEGAYHSMYGLRYLSASKSGERFSSNFAAIWCGWTSGILPSGHMNSRSYGVADGVRGPNDSPNVQLHAQNSAMVAIKAERMEKMISGLCIVDSFVDGVKYIKLHSLRIERSFTFLVADKIPDGWIRLGDICFNGGNFKKDYQHEETNCYRLNDAGKSKFVDEAEFKKALKAFASDVLEKGATPVICGPVANAGWREAFCGALPCRCEGA